MILTEHRGSPNSWLILNFWYDMLGENKTTVTQSYSDNSSENE